MNCKTKPINFSYSKYNVILFLKLFEVIVKEFIKFILVSRDNQKKRFFWERLGVLPSIIRKSDQVKWIWIHANSIGEVNASVSLTKLIKNIYRYNPILITTSNFSADERARQLKIADAVVFFPYDVPFIIKRFFSIFNPFCVIIIECDVWPNFVTICKDKCIPIFIVSGVFANSNTRSLDLRYLYNFKFRLSEKVLQNISQFCMQTQEDAERVFNEMPYHKNISVTGNLKFGCANGKSAFQDKDYYQRLFKMNDRDPVFIAGNVHKEEIEIVLDAFKITKERMPALIMILAPRFIKDISSIELLFIKKGLSFIRRTWLDSQKRTDEHVILLDTMGELAAVYGVGKVAFVGGSLVYLGEMFGGHNILEPAVLGVPVLFGPHMHNFQSLADLFYKRKAALQINNKEELAEGIWRLLGDADESYRLTSNVKTILEENKFIAERTFSAINDRLKTRAL